MTRLGREGALKNVQNQEEKLILEIYFDSYETFQKVINFNFFPIIFISILTLIEFRP